VRRSTGMMMIPRPGQQTFMRSTSSSTSRTTRQGNDLFLLLNSSCNALDFHSAALRTLTTRRAGSRPLNLQRMLSWLLDEPLLVSGLLSCARTLRRMQLCGSSTGLSVSLTSLSSYYLSFFFVLSTIISVCDYHYYLVHY
jgi:hypothetical protein